MRSLKHAVAAAMILMPGLAPAQDQAFDHTGRTADLLQQLRDADAIAAKKIERELDLAWARSGSPAMDLLLTRGQDAFEAGELDLAVGHFSALIDHAPEFAEAYHRRATAFFRQQELGLALSDLARTLTLNPDHFEATYGLGVVLESLKKYDDAYAAYETVLEAYPTHEGALEAVDRLRAKVSGQSL